MITTRAARDGARQSLSQRSMYRLRRCTATMSRSSNISANQPGGDDLASYNTQSGVVLVERASTNATSDAERDAASQRGLHRPLRSGARNDLGLLAVLASRRYRLAGLTPSSSAIWLMVRSPWAPIARAAASLRLVTTAGRPPVRPRARAASRDVVQRSRDRPRGPRAGREGVSDGFRSLSAWE